jgi:hypothetical protein
VLSVELSFTTIISAEGKLARSLGSVRSRLSPSFLAGIIIDNEFITEIAYSRSDLITVSSDI